MLSYKKINVLLIGLFFIFMGCTENSQVIPDQDLTEMRSSHNGRIAAIKKPQNTGKITANGWYEEEEIYYILQGVEKGVTERGENQLYFIGGDRLFQANVALFIPGEPGYSVHWNVNVVHTAEGVTADDIINSPFVSTHREDEGVLFDDVEDILGAQEAGLVTIDRPGIVVNCPVISEEGAEAPGHRPLSEDFPPIPNIF